MENNRFTSEYIGRYIAEHDSADDSLRLSWSGDQLFMSEDEARALLAFLQQRYPFEDTIRYETDYGYLEGAGEPVVQLHGAGGREAVPR